MSSTPEITGAAAPAATGPDRARLLDAMLASAVDFAVIATDEDGCVLEWNAGAEILLGWTAAEMVGQLADCIFPPGDRSTGLPALERAEALRHGRANHLRWHVRRDGAAFWASSALTTLRDHGGAPLGFMRTLRDRTEGRRMQDALRAAQGLNLPLLHSSRDCIVVLGLDGTTQYVSPGGIESMEVSDVGVVIGTSWLRVWQGEDRAAAEAAVNAARAGRTGRFTGFCATHKGTPKWWDVLICPLPGPDGRPERLASVGRDITGAVQAQERLNASEAALRALNVRLEADVEQRTRERDLLWLHSDDLLATAEYGSRLIAAADGAAGLGVLRSDSPVDLLITDVGLPGGINGRQVADAGRALRPGLKVLFITGYAESAVLGDGKLEPGMRVLTKPFEMAALVAQVGELVRSGGAG